MFRDLCRPSRTSGLISGGFRRRRGRWFFSSLTVDWFKSDSEPQESTHADLAGYQRLRVLPSLWKWNALAALALSASSAFFAMSYPVALKLLAPCGTGLAVGDEVVDSKRVTPVRSREADEPEGSR